MPGALIERHVLHQLAITPNQQMRRHLKLSDARKIGVRLSVQTVAKQLIDIITIKLLGRQADTVNDQQRNIILIRARITIRRSQLSGAVESMFENIHDHQQNQSRAILA